MRAFVVREDADGLHLGVSDHEAHALDEGDVLVDLDYASVNFKDALVACAPSRVRRGALVVGGLDGAGTVREGPGFVGGERVAVHGGVLGVARDGTFAEHVFAPAAAISPLPASISTRQAATIGTAGLTSVASLLALEDHGLAPGARVLVTGATGGVGSQAVHFLALRGYDAVASTRDTRAQAWLRDLGASDVVGRAVSDRPERVLGTERWDGAVDCVGGTTLAEILRSLHYGGAVAASGLVAGTDLVTTVYPFITRAVTLIGVDTVAMGPTERARCWSVLGDLAPRVDFDALVERVVGLDGVGAALDVVRAGATRGRLLVDPAR